MEILERSDRRLVLQAHPGAEVVAARQFAFVLLALGLAIFSTTDFRTNPDYAALSANSLNAFFHGGSLLLAIAGFVLLLANAWVPETYVFDRDRQTFRRSGRRWLWVLPLPRLLPLEALATVSVTPLDRPGSFSKYVLAIAPHVGESICLAYSTGDRETLEAVAATVRCFLAGESASAYPNDRAMAEGDSARTPPNQPPEAEEACAPTHHTTAEVEPNSEPDAAWVQALQQPTYEIEAGWSQGALWLRRSVLVGFAIAGVLVAMHPEWLAVGDRVTVDIGAGSIALRGAWGLLSVRVIAAMFATIALGIGLLPFSVKKCFDRDRQALIVTYGTIWFPQSFTEEHPFAAIAAIAVTSETLDGGDVAFAVALRLATGETIPLYGATTDRDRADRAAHFLRQYVGVGM